ncbi:MAG: HAD family phosphatase [Deltaproteobacteria bacterium]|nr:HAD family phosphatase [Deltaproteobacteria bacterium]
MNNGLFITDFDGTLLRSDGTLAQRDLEALEDLNRCGIKTAVATGRSLYSFRGSPGVDLPVDYIIFTTGAGAITQTEGKLLYACNLSTEMVARALTFFKQSAFDFMLHYPVPENHHFFYRQASGNNTDFKTRLDRYRQFGKPLNSVSADGFREASQFLAVVPETETDDALAMVRSALPELSVIHTTSPLDHRSTWIELFHPDVSKSSTAAWLAAELDINQTKTMAVGNDYNDIDLLEWAAKSFVVENAPQDLKARFQTVASNNDGGVADAIAQWIKK